MQQLIKNFDFNGSGIRVITNEENQIFFVAKDVCDVLGYTKSTSAIIDSHCKVEGCTKMVLPSDGGNQEQIVINEGNLYRLVLKSKKKEAEKFESWVCDEVLPSIRKTGKFEVEKPQTSMEILASAVLLAQQVISQKDEQIKQLAPKAEYTEKVLQSKTTLTTTEVAKDLGITAIKLNEFLCEQKVQAKHREHYMLLAKYQGKGYERITTQLIVRDNEAFTKMQLEWTERGRAFIHYLYNQSLSFSKNPLLSVQGSLPMVVV